MKRFGFSHGEVELDLPDSWEEDREEDGDVGVFCSDAEDAGVLRIRGRVLYNPNQLVSDDAATEMLEALAERMMPGHTHEAEKIDDRTYLVSFAQPLPEHNPPLIIASWLTATLAPPHSMPMICYTYTVPGEFAATGATLAELRLIEAAIRDAECVIDAIAD